MLSNNLCAKLKIENCKEMENVESPSKYSPMNLSTRPIERNVLKELNNLEGATKSSKQVSTTNDPDIQLKDSNNSSNNLPDIVTNVQADGNQVVNKNLLYVATPPDVQSSDDEFLDCDTTLTDKESGVNKRIDKVSKILDETIQILEREKLNEGFIEAQSDNLTVKYPVNNLAGETSENITEDFPKENVSLCINGTENAGLTENCIEVSSKCIAESLLCQQEKPSNEALVEHIAISNESNESNRPTVTHELEQDTSIARGDRSTTLDVIESVDPVVESAEIVVETEVSVVETAVPVIDSVVPVNESEVVHNSLEVAIDSSKGVIDSSEAVIESVVSVLESEKISLDVIESADPVVETAVPVIDSVVPVNESEVVHNSLEVAIDSSKGVIDSSEVIIDSSEVVIESVVSVLETAKISESSGNLTKTDVELNSLNETVNTLPKSDNSSTCLQEASFSLTNNEINQTVTIESNPENLDEIITEGSTIVPEELSNTTEQKQLEKIHEFKANQTISVDSLDIDGDTRECSLDSLEMKQPTQHDQATPIDKSLPTTMGDEIFSKKQSPDLTEMFTNVNQTTNESSNRFSENSMNERERSYFDKTYSNEKLIRSEATQFPNFVDSNGNSKEMLEAPITVMNEVVDPISNMSPQNTASSPAGSPLPEDNSEIVQQISQFLTGKSPKESSINEKSDITNFSPNTTTNSLKRRRDFTISCEPNATPPVLEEFKSDQSLFPFKAPSLPILSPGKPKKDQFEDNDSSNFMVLNSNDFDFLQSRGGNSDPEEDRRSSLLLRFDPLSGRSVHTTKFAASAPIAEETVVCETDLNGSEVTPGSFNNTSASQLLSTNETPSDGILVEISTRMDNEANGYLNNTRTEKSDDKLISVGGVSLTDKKIKLECNDSDIQKKMEEYEATQDILLKRITEKDKAITKTSNVLELYEKAIAEALAAKEKLSQTYDQQHEELKTDRDVNFQHLLSLETTFADLHMKFERNVQYTTQLQEKLNAVAEEKAKAEDLLKQQELRYDKMKSHTMQQFDIANTKLDQQTKTVSSENIKLKAQIKREEIHKNAVQEELLQKKKENEELVKICDELISGQRS